MKPNVMTILLYLILALFSSTIHAKNSPSENLVKSYYSAIGLRDFDKLSLLIHSDELETFRKEFLSLYEMEKKDGKSDLLRASFGPSATMSLVKSSSAKDMFSKVMSFTMNSRALHGLEILEPEILGSVSEGIAIKHIVFRYKFKFNDMMSSNVQVITTRMEIDGWKILLPEKLKKMSYTIKQRMLMSQKRNR